MIGRVAKLSRSTARLTGNNLVGGWGARNYNWQFGLGVQHEVLPRLSVDVTYKRRYAGNQTADDTGRAVTGSALVPSRGGLSDGLPQLHRPGL